MAKQSMSLPELRVLPAIVEAGGVPVIVRADAFRLLYGSPILHARATLTKNGDPLRRSDGRKK